MIHILARNDQFAKAFAGDVPYKLATTASELFGATTIHVMFDWESQKNTCDLKKIKTMLLAHSISPRCKVVRHDKIMI
jgi:hypothetical protein